jgi:hypothetical protein
MKPLANLKKLLGYPSVRKADIPLYRDKLDAMGEVGIQLKFFDVFGRMEDIVELVERHAC